MRLTFGQVRQSRLPAVLGNCAADIPSIRRYVNEAQQRLIQAGGETGWYGGWQRTVFTVASDDTITLPREIIRIQNAAVCEHSVPIQNGFYEFLEGGIGPQPETGCNGSCSNAVRLLDRGMYPTLTQITSTDQRIRVYPTNAQDYGKRILFSGLDANGVTIRSQDGLVMVNGEYVELASPFTDTVSGYSDIIGVQKDLMVDDVLVYQYDMVTGDEVLLSRYAPDELIPQYRRYYIDNKPSWCCAGQTVQVQGMAKLEAIPVYKDTDFLVIGCLPALIAECEAIRYSEMDSPTALAMEDRKHKEAIRLLQNELRHYLGSQKPAITNPIYGTAKLQYQRIGYLV